MAQIGYVAPNKEMIKVAEMVFNAGSTSVLIEEGNFDYGVEVARSMIEQGVKVIISRGGTADCIRKKLNIPVIEIPLTFEDVADAIIKASNISDNIAVVGFYNIFNGLKLLNPLLKINLEQVYIKNELEVRNSIINLKNKGIDVIIGGDIQCYFANEFGMKSVMLLSSIESIEHAYKEAETLLFSILVEERRTKEIQAIIDHSREGYIGINKNTEITLINSTAFKLLPLYDKKPIGKKLKDIFPDLKNFLEVLYSDKSHIQDVVSVGSTNILCESIPIETDDNEVVGAIVTFKDINIIQADASKTRSKFISKGLYAKYTFDDVKGESKSIKKTLDYAKQFACTDSTILLIGNTGVGKELFAQGIHNVSNRRNGPFIGVNCASLPESILESELFGYEEGAFTGAKKSGKPGLFELAHEGTIFLDEIGEIPLRLQSLLLRVLQEKEIMRLGDNKVIPVNVRIIAATNKNLAKLVAERKFRDDLYFRLNILTVFIPNLSQRKEDIPVLAQYMLKNISNKEFILTKDAIKALSSYSWPGNVRELRNLMERISIISTSNTIDDREIKIFLSEQAPLFNAQVEEKHITLNKENIIEAMEMAEGNRMKAAEILGVHRTTLWRNLKMYDLDK